jgi:hypothetical protein
MEYDSSPQDVTLMSFTFLSEEHPENKHARSAAAARQTRVFPYDFILHMVSFPIAQR